MVNLQECTKKKLFICLVIIAAANYLLGSYLPVEDCSRNTTDWDRVKNVFNAFLEYPSPENAKAVWDILPHDKIKTINEDISKLVDHIHSWRSYGILRNEIWAGNRYAVEAAFRMLNFADGEFAENLCATLGSLIRINPRLFLEVLYEYKESWIFQELRCFVYNLDDAYVDRPKAQIYEYKMKIAALENVKDEKYRDIKKACIDQLRKAID